LTALSTAKPAEQGGLRHLNPGLQDGLNFKTREKLPINSAFRPSYWRNTLPV